MREIPLSNGMVVTIDDSDYKLVKDYKWTAAKTGEHIYPMTTTRNLEGDKIRVPMHRIILDLIDENRRVVHLDGNKLNNTRDNLKLSPKSNNNKSYTPKPVVPSRETMFWFNPNVGKYEARINDTHIGFYDDPDEAFRVSFAAQVAKVENRRNNF